MNLKADGIVRAQDENYDGDLSDEESDTEDAPREEHLDNSSEVDVEEVEWLLSEEPGDMTEDGSAKSDK